MDMEHLPMEQLVAGLDEVRKAPADDGRVELLVRRPAVDEREVVDQVELDGAVGVVGDNWKDKGSSRTPDGSADPLKQLTIMNVRAASLVAGDPERRPLAGDQIYVDLDISTKNAPPGTRLELGTAVVEITEPPHRGCAKFAARFGRDALKLVNSDVGVALNLRGVNAKIVTPGTVRLGDRVKVRRPATVDA
jgi:hypothetical protein